MVIPVMELLGVHVSIIHLYMFDCKFLFGVGEKFAIFHAGPAYFRVRMLLFCYVVPGLHKDQLFPTKVSAYAYISYSVKVILCTGVAS